ncbi:MAG: hypothetical protein M1840_009124 [Geoglossum simile]|nr:MAG: hypothetical protein M1840_009124 [Geoglossum simile]
MHPVFLGDDIDNLVETALSKQEIERIMTDDATEGFRDEFGDSPPILAGTEVIIIPSTGGSIPGEHLNNAGNILEIELLENEGLMFASGMRICSTIRDPRARRIVENKTQERRA